jgi:hypothetical protein
MSEIGRGVLGRYYAGLWEVSLPHSLLWSATPLGGKRFPGFVAPSWSWASFDGRVTVSSESLGLREKKIRIRCMNCVVKLAQNFAPFGAVNSGSLFLKGRVVRGAVGEDSEDGDFAVYNVWLEYADDCVSGYLDDHCSRAARDNEGRFRTGPPISVIWALMVASDGRSWSGLLLDKTDYRAERYRRVGSCSGRLTGNGERFWAEQPSRVIELI